MWSATIGKSARTPSGSRRLSDFDCAATRAAAAAATTKERRPIDISLNLQSLEGHTTIPDVRGCFRPILAVTQEPPGGRLRAGKARSHDRYCQADSRPPERLQWTSEVTGMNSSRRWMLCGNCCRVRALRPEPRGLSALSASRRRTSRGAIRAVIASVTIAPGASAGRHTHPGEEISYVIEGEGEILIEGQPALQIKALRHDGFVIPAGAIHDAHNTGTVHLLSWLPFTTYREGQAAGHPRKVNASRKRAPLVCRRIPSTTTGSRP